MREQAYVAAFFLVLAIPGVLLIFCWRTWRTRSYKSGRRKRASMFGLAFATYSALFLVLLPVSATVPIRSAQTLKSALMETWFVSGVVSAPIAAVMLAFAQGMERWLGVAMAVLCLILDIVLARAAAV